MNLYTLGHSTRSTDEFLTLLWENGVRRLLDVRAVPRSRHNPQYNTEILSRTLAAADIAYTHLPALGGLRKPRKDSVNMGWRNDSFRGYADYMQSGEFHRALDDLLTAAAEPAALMCAEADPWRCHRLLIADAASLRGIEVRHILALGKWQPHKLPPFALVDGLIITYPFALEG